jgi:hypothetical protein
MNKIALSQPRLAWAGVVGPALFVIIFTLEGWLRTGYEPARMYISELSLGSGGWIQNANFIIFGVLFLVFTRRVAAEFRHGKASQWGTILLTIIATCYLAFGFFVMDPVGTAASEMTLHGILHGLLGEVVLALMPVSCFVYLQRYREDTKWQYLQGWMLGLGTISAIAGTLLIVAMNLPAVQRALDEWLGLIQRIAIIPFTLWLFIFALGLLRRR